MLIVTLGSSSFPSQRRITQQQIGSLRKTAIGDGLYMKARLSEDPDLCIQFEHFDHGSLQLTKLTSAPFKKA
jgi:hypothetical protein